MKKDIKKLLGLQHLWVDSWEIKEKLIEVKVRSPRKYCKCLVCGFSTKHVHQKKERKLKHSVWQEREVILKLTQRRFFCQKCKKIFTEKITGIDKRRTTENYRAILLKKLARSSLSYTMKTTKTSSSVLYQILREKYQQNKEVDWRKEGDKIQLGIDEHSYRGKKMSLTITNISKKKLLTILENDKKVTLKKWLNTIDKKRIDEVCIDMRRGFLYAIRETLPEVKIVADKFHVIAYANKAMDEIRSIIVPKRKVKRLLFKGKEKLNDQEKAKLEDIFKQYQEFPSLYEAYFIKEKLRSFYHLKDKQLARKKLDLIIMFCENSQSRYVKAMGRTLVFWKEYILNYFDNYSTNAFTEGCHTKIKMIKRMSFGFRNIKNYIAKISLAFLPLLEINHHTF
jgi:transposase